MVGRTSEKRLDSGYLLKGELTGLLKNWMWVEGSGMGRKRGFMVAS